MALRFEPTVHVAGSFSKAKWDRIQTYIHTWTQAWAEVNEVWNWHLEKRYKEQKYGLGGRQRQHTYVGPMCNKQQYKTDTKNEDYH